MIANLTIIFTCCVAHGPAGVSSCIQKTPEPATGALFSLRCPCHMLYIFDALTPQLTD